MLDSSVVSDMKWMYEQLYPNEAIHHLNLICYSFSKVSICGEVLSCGNKRNSCVAAHWLSPALEGSSSTLLRFGHIQYFIRHSIHLSVGQKEHIIAVIDWFKPHPDEMYYGYTSFVLRKDTEGLYKYSYLPVQRIANRCCFGNKSLELSSGPENITVIIPIQFRFSL